MRTSPGIGISGDSGLPATGAGGSRGGGGAAPGRDLVGARRGGGDGGPREGGARRGGLRRGAEGVDRRGADVPDLCVAGGAGETFVEREPLIDLGHIVLGNEA